jgi:predicted nucleic acid-binding protein
VARTAYLDTSVFLEIGARRSKVAKEIKALLAELTEDRVRIYTSIITVQEMSVASYRKGGINKDTYGDIQSLARIYGVTKEVALTAAHREAELRDNADSQLAARDPKKPETEDERLERICENRKRRWDCFHIATAQVIGCSVMYSTDTKLQRRFSQLNIRDLKIVAPKPTEPSIEGPLFRD